jgi:L-asparaginase II
MVIEVTRGEMVESRHQVLAAMVRTDGTVLRAWGDASFHIYARSALKPMQACAVVDRSGGRFEFTEHQLALACASHNGEKVHVTVVREWLDQLGRAPAHLECGAHEPIDAAEAHELVCTGRKPGNEHNNCSGKHCGLLTLSHALQVDPSGYLDYNHPVQIELRRSLSAALEYRLDDALWGGDGCGIPTYAMPLSVLARAFARLANPPAQSSSWLSCSQRVVRAMTRHPYLIAGRNRFDTAVMALQPGRVVVKGGAEGVCAAGIAGADIGLALKVVDGGRRAADVAMAALLAYAGALESAQLAMLGDFVTTPVRNVAGKLVGAVRSAESER